MNNHNNCLTTFIFYCFIQYYPKYVIKSCKNPMANSSKYVTVKSQGHHEKTRKGEFKTE